MFDREDANKDGFISFAEFSGPKGLPANNNNNNNQAGAAQSGNGNAAKPLQFNLFASMDTDSSGSVSQAEMTEFYVGSTGQVRVLE